MTFGAWPQTLPHSLASLEVINSDLSVHHLDGYLPQSLQRLKLRGTLELSSAFWTIPSSLTKLDLNLCQHGKWYNIRSELPEASQISPVFRSELMILPASLLSLNYLPPIDQSVLSQVRLPPRLRYLQFGVCFNGPLDQLNLPDGLEELALVRHFNSNIDLVRFPSSIRTLSLGCHSQDQFNQPVLQWLPLAPLTELYLGRHWNRPLADLCLSATLRRLTLNGFNQPIPGEFLWPPDLEYLEFGRTFDQALDVWSPPPRLSHLKIDRNSFWNLALNDQRWPPELRQLELPLRCYRLTFLQWPSMLSQWTVYIRNEIQSLDSTPIVHYKPFTAAFRPGVLDAIKCMPPLLRKLNVELPFSAATPSNLWDLMESFANILPHTVSEVVLFTQYTSIEQHFSSLPAIRRFRSLLPPSCSFRFSQPATYFQDSS